MDKDLALKIFTLGVRHGVHQKTLGMDIARMSDERLAEILHDGFVTYLKEIEQHSQNLANRKAADLFYAQYWTVKQSFTFGLLTGFAEWPKIPADKKGKKILTNEMIDDLAQKQFRQIKTYGED